MRGAGRRGFAVMLALFAVILFGAIATAMAYAANLETRASSTMLGASRSLSAAESAAWETIASYDWLSALSLVPGQSTHPLSGLGQVTSSVYIVRLDSTCFLVQATAVSGPNVAGSGRFIRRVGITIEVTRDTAGSIRASRVPNRAWTELF